jgi:predicted phosphoribosyltransferase
MLHTRSEQYDTVRPQVDLTDKIVVLVDDGIATGHTMLAAIKLLKHQHPRKIVVAVPVSSVDALKTVSDEVDEVVCLLTPTPFFGIGQFYYSFPQVSDHEALTLLRKANSCYITRDQ